MTETPRYRDENWLRDQLGEHSVEQVAKECEVTRKTIYKWGGKFGIDFQNPTQFQKGETPWNHEALDVPEPWSSEDMSYIFGVLIGDGSLHWSRKGGRRHPKGIQLTTVETEFIDELEKAVSNCLDLEVKRYQDGHAIKSMVLSADLCRSLSQYNVSSDSWRIPKEFFESKDSVKRSLVQGVMDSDGTVTDGIPRLCSTNLDGLTDVKVVVETMGMNTVMYSPQRKETTFGDVIEYGLRIKSPGRVFRLQRKQKKVRT